MKHLKAKTFRGCASGRPLVVHPNFPTGYVTIELVAEGMRGFKPAEARRIARALIAAADAADAGGKGRGE